MAKATEDKPSRAGVEKRKEVKGMIDFKKVASGFLEDDSFHSQNPQRYPHIEDGSIKAEEPTFDDTGKQRLVKVRVRYLWDDDPNLRPQAAVIDVCFTTEEGEFVRLESFYTRPHPPYHRRFIQ